MTRPDVPAATVETAVAWRRHLHAHPELAFAEHDTAAFLTRQLAEFGYALRPGYGGTGVVASLSKGTSARSIGLRADMDALPIDERTGATHASTVAGRMHACGHDGHMAMLLGAASLIRDLDFDGTVRLIFQPAEENEGGGRRMVEEGIFGDLPVDQVFGLHNWPTLPAGRFVAGDGPIMAAFSVFDVAVVGRGAHGAMPEESADPVVAAAAVISSLQTVVSRNLSPLDSAVLSVTRIHGGEAYNIIPGRVDIGGGARWFSAATGERLEAQLGAIAAAVASAHGCTADVTYERRYPATINEPAAAHRARAAATAIGLEVIDRPPSMASEDFAFMLAAVPGAYGWLGSGRTDGDAGLHSPFYDFNDAVIPDGIAYWLALVGGALGR